jgi:uncharacterized protein (TIGR02147 family)
MKLAFSERLAQELEIRRLKNTSYSMRAFAAFLGTNVSILSGLLSGKRKLNHKYIEDFGLKIGLTIYEVIAYQKALDFTNSFQDDHILTKYAKVTIDSYQILSEWHHIAILYVRKDGDTLKSVAEIAKSLSLSETKVSEALGRLERLEIIKKAGSTYKVLTNSFMTNIDSDLGRAAGRKFIRDILHKSLEALDEIPIEHRDHSSITMSFSPDKMTEAKEAIKKFRRKFLANFDEVSKKNKVYTLQLSLFPLSDPE